MPELNFAVIDAQVPAFAAQPQLNFQLRIESNPEPGEPEREMHIDIYNIALRCQIQIAATQRRYQPQEQERLSEVFGTAERWKETLHSLLWTHASVIVPRFTHSTIVDLAIPCTYDFEVVSTKYFDALTEGEIPLTFLFSGTIFYADETGNLQIGQIPWSKEASYRLPVARWREVIQRYYPNSAWIRMQKDVFDQLYSYKRQLGSPTWDDTLLHLLQAAHVKGASS